MHALSSEFRALTLGESGRTQDTSSAVTVTIPERSVAEGPGRARQCGWGWGSVIRQACTVQTVGSKRAVADRPPNVLVCELERNFVRDDTCEGVSLCRGQ